jgi:hypothetical protein
VRPSTPPTLLTPARLRRRSRKALYSSRGSWMRCLNCWSYRAAETISSQRFTDDAAGRSSFVDAESLRRVCARRGYSRLRVPNKSRAEKERSPKKRASALQSIQFTMSSQLLSPNREAAIWARLIRAQRDDLSSDAAEFLPRLLLMIAIKRECLSLPTGRRLES